MEASAPRVPEGYRVDAEGDVGSTNALALDRARAGEPSGLWITARRQIAGRGRQGRVWTSEPGNLYASLLLRDPAPPERIGELPLLVAVAVHDAIADVLPPPARPDLAIKWPNDVLFRGAKLCGILIEGAAGPEGRVVVIGVGVNCRHHPRDLGAAATDLAEIGYPTEPSALFERLALRMAERLAEWRGGPFAPIREAWLNRARGIGETVLVRLPQGTLTGRFEALDADGRLLLRLPEGGLETISAGDVFFGAAASARHPGERQA
ncbi:MAG TPA: biotin--[acetyl-CoA-carboxylase] ligase [Methylomirabilota bacterium]|nr:biotin--[acetyl-CoA-carboxylase] ligase [Methylomirabilota bacterium]